MAGPGPGKHMSEGLEACWNTINSIRDRSRLCRAWRWYIWGIFFNKNNKKYEYKMKYQSEDLFRMGK